MTPAEVLAIVQIFATLEPVAVQGINAAINMFQNHTGTSEDKMKMLTDMAAGLKAMELKP